MHQWEQARAVLEENYSVRRTLDYYAHRAFNSKQGLNETVSQWGARMDTMCGDLQKAARKHMEDLAWSSEKREGGGDIIDLLMRACFIQGLYDDRIKTMVKTKGNVNTPVAQLVEVALEEESAIRSERSKRNFSERGHFGNQRYKDGQGIKTERTEVRTATRGCAVGGHTAQGGQRCYRCHKKGHLMKDCKAFLSASGKGRETDTSKAEREVDVSGDRYRGYLGNRR